MSQYQELRNFLTSRKPGMFDLLRRMVEIQSHSYNKVGNGRMMALIASEFENSSLTGTEIVQETFGNHLVVRSHATSNFSTQVLLVGHTDTVFPEDSAFKQYSEDGQNCYGPGVIDMKGGLTVGIYALKALDAFGLLSNIPVTFIFNSDEEIGSRSSGSIIRQEARKSLFSLVLECGGMDGEIVTGRKGNMSVRMETFGKAGHAATSGQNKASAVLELAHKIILFENLNDPSRNITANAGKISGGIGPNTVADYAMAGIDVRYENPSDKAQLEEKIEQIAAANYVSGVTTQVQIVSGRPPMQRNAKNRRLFNMLKTVATDLNMDIKEEFRFGVSDANLIADENTPVIDGLGPIGADDHSEKEYMIKETLLERTVLLACSIPACWQRYADCIGNS
jgi:glutamate carboxypeptidase